MEHGGWSTVANQERFELLVIAKEPTKILGSGYEPIRLAFIIGN